MEKLFEFFSPHLVSALGWALVHSIWQGTVLSLIYATLLRFIRASEKRYLLGISILFLQVVLSVATYFSVYENSQEFLIQNPQTKVFWQIVFLQSADKQLSIIEKVQFFFSSNLPIFVQIWLIGIVFFLIKLSVSFWYVNRLKTVGLQKASKKVEEIFYRILEKIQISRDITIHESNKIALPMVIGHFKPLILLPVGLAAQMTFKEIEAVLIHEIAHIKRNDFLFNILQSFVEILFFFHPAIWWVSSKIREERENCCDDFSMKFTEDKMLLVNALARIESFRHEPKLAMAFGKKQYSLLNRVRRILEITPQKNKSNQSFFGATILLLFLGIYLTFDSQKAISQTPKSSQQAKTIVRKPVKIEINAPLITDSLYHRKGVMHFFNGKTKVYVTRDGEIFINGKRHNLTEAEIIQIKKHIAEIEILEKEMKPLSDKMEIHGKEMEAYGKRMESYSPQMNEMSKQMEFQGKKIEENARLMEKYSLEMSRLDENSSRYKEIEKLNKENEKILREYSEAMEKSAKEMEIYSKQMEKFEFPMDSLGKLMEQYEKPMEEIGKKIEVEAKAIEEFFPPEIRRELQRSIGNYPPPPPPPPAPSRKVGTEKLRVPPAPPVRANTPKAKIAPPPPPSPPKKN